MLKAVVIGRHELLPRQLSELRRLGVSEVMYVVSLPDNAEELDRLVRKWKEQGARAVIVQALPLRLLVHLWNVCRKHGLDLLVAEMVTVGAAGSEEEAKRIVNENPDARTYLRAPGDKAIRVVEFKGWRRVRTLKVELEEV